MRWTIEVTMAALLALVLGVNGLAMLFAGPWWYGVVPGVSATGPCNAHFVKDIGAAYLVAGVSLGAFAWRSGRAFAALVAAAAFLTLHAAIHIADALASPTCGQNLVRDLPGVFLPALVSLGLVASFLNPAKETAMLRAIFSRYISGMEKDWNYDASYMREVLATSPWTFLKFGIVTTVVPRGDAPAEALAAAGLVGTLTEDCGPCTQIGVDMAAKGGVKPEILRAILAGDEAAMGETAALAYRFAKASLERRLGEADALREEVVRRWSQKGLVALALALTTARMYPTLKYALGHGKSCSLVTVAGEAAPFHPPLAEAA
jgi:hypothetical protein